MANDKKNSSDTDGSTPLQRYLAKQRASQATSGASGETRGEVAAPVPAPGPATTGAGTKATADAAQAGVMSAQPASFGSRFAAFLIDAVFVYMLTSICATVLGLGLFFLPQSVRDVLGHVSRFVVIFFYYGWFYAEKSASPGKMLLNLEIKEAGTGRPLSYGRTFFRETTGKMLSGALLGIGYFIAYFRADHLALHDMIFDTRVWQRRKSS